MSRLHLPSRIADPVLLTLLLLASMFLIGATGHAQGAPAARSVAAGSVEPMGPPPGVLRVCADPDNLPFSDSTGAGIENKLAALLAAETGRTVSYTWWPQRRGFVRNTLRAHECDALLGVPTDFDPVAATAPYYRSTYYLVSRRDRALGLTSLDDPKLRTLRLAVNVIGEDYTNTPPAHALGERGIVVARGYDTFYNTRRRPGDIIDAVVKGDVDVAVVWGPLAGYFARRAGVPLDMVALPDTDSLTGLPFAYDIALGVRRSDRAFRAELEGALQRRRAEVTRLLTEYGFPTLPAPAQAP
jgi:quinoprotein dehydrogenase-associated probable ABC transporter substrate-binding protein